MAEIVISIAAKVAELLVVPIGKHICYPFKCQSNIDGLKKQVTKLTDARDRVLHSVDKARRQGNEIENDVQKWLNSVDEFTQGVENTIIGDEDNAKKRCFMGLCPNLMTRYSLSKKALKKTKDVVNLLGEGEFKKVAYPPVPKKRTSTYIRGYEDFDSRKEVFNSIMEALKNDDVNLIGVHGMGGVGKTTLVKKVAAQVEKDELFNEVIFVDVTQPPEIKDIQGQIADKLDLKFNKETLAGRADQLSDRLKKEKKVLVVLDNVWEKLDLEGVGIPLKEEEKRSSRQADRKGRSDEQRQCKVLLTSRKQRACDEMNTQKNFSVGTLSEEEAENLFWKIVPLEETSDPSEFVPIGVEIVGHCAGLPLAIETIANALKKKDPSHWKDALHQLISSNPSQIIGMEEKVYAALKLSYEWLESEDAKSLFLLCSLFQASYNISVNDLLRYAMGLSLFQNVYNTVEKGRNRLHTLIDNLKASSLLLDGITKERVKMHDIIHDVAVSIAKEKLMFIIPNDESLKEMLEEEKLRTDATAISLTYGHGDRCELPERLELPKLKLLNLQENYGNLLPISDHFFEEVKELKVLALTNFKLLSLPSSLQLLTNLQTLCLDQSVLGDIATIGALPKLEVLSLLSSYIEHLPIEIKQLTRLKLLDMSECTSLKTITPGVISSLTRLEELYIGNSFVKWDIDGQTNASLSELKQLCHLTTLEIHIPDAHIVPQDLFFGKLERYKIFIGDNVNTWDWHGNYETSKTLRLKWSNRICLGDGIKTLLNKTEDLYLDELKGVKNVLYEFDEEGFPRLKYLHIQNDPEIQYIINSVRLGTSPFFPKLESLFLQNLINLEKMCHGQLAADSFINLRIVKLGKCDRLKHLFSFSMAKNLLKLQEIKVTNCKKLEEIVSKESNEQFQQHNRVSRIELIQLRTLKLKCLPRLTSFDFKEFTPDIGSQEIVAEDEAGGLTSLFSQNVVLPSLENLKLSSINIGCTWLDQLPAISSCCQTLTSLTLEDCCGNLKFLFSYFKVKSLVLLENLEIRSCKSIEEIINTGELRGEGKVIKMVFPKLIKLQLKGLPNLTQFGFVNSIEFPSLTQVSVENCPRLKIFFSVSAAADLNCQDDIETINNALFPKLNRLALIDLQELTSFCNFVGNAIELPSLARLWIKNCPNMQTFISNSTCADMSTSKVVLPVLASLNLSSIGIQTIWHNQLETMSSCFQNLTEITIDNFDTLKYVFSYSMVESLIQLKVLQISNCKFMEMVIINQGEKISNTLFPKLYWLDLKHLPELTSFCNFAGNSTELPSLSHLWLDDCPKLQTFVSISPHADMSASKEEKMDSEENHHAPIQPLFDERVQLPNLEDLKINNMENVRKVWHHQLTSVFCKLNVFSVDGCHNLLSVFPSNTLGRLQKLDRLMVSNCKSLEVIFEENVAKEEDVEAAVFPQLTLLRLADLPKLRIIATSQIYISRLPMLKTLRMWGCKRLQRLTSEFQSFQENHGQPPITVDKVAFPNLEELSLGWNYIAKEWMNENFSGNSCKLKDLELIDASKEAALCPCFFLYELPNLEKLHVFKCVLEEMFICKGHGCKEKYMAEAPSKLNCLRLTRLNDSLNLGEENSLLCKIFQNLTTLEVSSCNKLKALVSSTVTFQNLTTLEVSKSGGLINLMAISTAKSLVQLARLKIMECKIIEEIIIHGGDREENPIIFSKLEYLELHCLQRLTSFYGGSYVIEFPSLQQIVVRQCPNMKIFSHGALSTPSLHKLQTKEADEGFWEGSLNTTIQKMYNDMDRFRGIENFTVSDFPYLKEVWHKQFLDCYFRNLKSLVVDDKCCSLIYVFTPSVALGLVQLQELELKNSAVLEAIIVIEEETIGNTLFPNLHTLKFTDLPKLSSFCNFTGNSIELPSLATLCIENCPNMQTFISNSIGADMSTSKDNLHTDIQPLFDEKVRLPNLKFLRLDKVDKLRKVWHYQLTSDSFCKLDTFWVFNCHNVLNVFPSNMLVRLQKLDELWLINCNSLDEIFELEASSSGKTQAITATQMRKLVLHDLPKLKHIWDVDSQGLLTWQNLLSIEVLRCDNLKSIFPASVGRNLLQLEQLLIEKCCMVEEIFAKEEQVDEAVPRFPQLTFLRLAELPRLRSFYPKVLVSEWPMLKKLHFWKCDKIEVSASKYLSFQVTQGESQHEMPLEQPLLLLDKVPFNNLESLTLDWKWILKESLHEKLPEYSCKLKVLTFADIHNEADICVSCLLHRLPDLERFQVRQGFFKEIFLYKGFGCEEKHDEAPSKLSSLLLLDLFDSSHLWEKNSLCSTVFQNLTILEVDSCGNLKCLVPSSVSFQNLTTLQVWKCNGLLNLVAAPTAKSMMNLRKLSISECEMIEEIIIHKGDEGEDWIIFKKLRNLELQCLPSLTSFYSGNYTTEFPSLQQVIVRECPNMKTFSGGVLSAPMLDRLHITEAAEGKGFWKGNLNTTVEHLFIESSKED